MKILLCGLGSIGQRHLQVLQEHFDHQLYALRSSVTSPSVDGVQNCFSWDDVKEINPDIAFITNPTSEHIPTAIKCAELGCHLFIEKPLSDKLDQIDQLEKIVEQNKLVTYVAYGLRFHPIIQKIKKLLDGKEILQARLVCSSYLPDWRLGEDHLKSYSANKDLGGGVVLDVSHELDYLVYLFGDIKRFIKRTSRIAEVTVDTEDVANILIETEHSVECNVHINFMSHCLERSLVIDIEGGYIKADLIANTLLVHDKGKEDLEVFSVDRNDVLQSQSTYFFEQLSNVSMMNNIKEAKSLLTTLVELRL